MKCPWCNAVVSQFDTFCPTCGRENIDFTKVNSNQCVMEVEEQPEIDFVMPKPFCSNCNRKMIPLGEQELQRASLSGNLFFGDWADLFHGTLRLNLYLCGRCGKAEFYASENLLNKIIRTE